MKTIVTHIGPDLDAITSVWLVKTFLPGWEEAALAFVPAGNTLEGKPPDDTPEILHVDTGFGKYDHHQSDADTCASLLVYEEVKKEHGADPALERLLHQVNDVDHFREVFYPEPTADVWDFGLVSQIDGWRLIYADDPIKIVNRSMAFIRHFRIKCGRKKSSKEKALNLKRNGVRELEWKRPMTKPFIWLRRWGTS